jgi:hypothetical protein
VVWLNYASVPNEKLLEVQGPEAVHDADYPQISGSVEQNRKEEADAEDRGEDPEMRGVALSQAEVIEVERAECENRVADQDSDSWTGAANDLCL